MTWLRLLVLAAGVLAGLQGATQFFAWTYRYDPVLGPALRPSADLAIYPPWAVLVWRRQFGDAADWALMRSAPLVLLGVSAGFGLMMVVDREPATRRRGWGGLAEARSAGLLDHAGAVLGVFKGRLLATADLRPSLVTGGTRSGKGRGHVVPTLLCWPGSALVHDPKRELWAITAGWRSGFSHALYLDPRDPHSARWNPLAEIRCGPGELAQVQRLVAILSDPGGARDEDTIWDKAAAEILEAVILHVLHTAEDGDKTLLKVRELLADLDATASAMLSTLHRQGPDGEAQTHPFIRAAATGYGAMHERFRTSVQGTARSYLKWLAGDDIERAVSSSDFAMGDLMCVEAPVSLYVQVAPADAAALKPLLRLLFYAAAQALTVEVDHDADGRPKHHKLLMLMDEFPLLGRVSFFEKSLRLLSGYGVKPMFVAQSLNDIIETYGPHNTILDNCAVYTAFSAADPLSQEAISKLTGAHVERRRSRSDPAGLSGGRSSVSVSEVERPLLEPGDVRALSDDQQIVFAVGRRPLLTTKLKYDRREPFRSRARVVAPDQARRLDAPPRRPHAWSGRRAMGTTSQADLRLFDRAQARADSGLGGRATAVMERVAQDMAAEQAVLDHLQGISRG